MAIGLVMAANAQPKFEEDLIKTSKGDLKITFIGHGTLMFTFGGMVIHVDPVGQYADYSTLPQADLILITHEHGDHLDPDVIETIRTDKTDLILTEQYRPPAKGKCPVPPQGPWKRLYHHFRGQKGICSWRY